MRSHWPSVPPASLPGDCELGETLASLCALGQLQLLKGLVPWKVSSPGLGWHTLPQPQGAHANAWPWLVLMLSHDYKATRASATVSSTWTHFYTGKNEV